MKVLSGALSEVASGPDASWELSFRMRSWGEATVEFPSDLCFLSASSLDSQSFAMAPPTDEVARSLHVLISKCLHGKTYCRQVLCLYELAKVCIRGDPQRSTV